MRIAASVKNGAGRHEVTLQTNETRHNIAIPPKESGQGSSANGGELLFLALATCYCNDIYREAIKRDIVVEYVEVTVEGQFGSEGEPARDVTYKARIKAQASPAEIEALVYDTDRVAEIQNTLREATPISLQGFEIVG